MKNALDEVRTGGLNRLWRAMVCLWLRCPHRARYEWQMGIDRLTDSGDYAPGGFYDTMFPGWRDHDCDYRRVRWNRAVALPNDHTSQLVEAVAIDAGILQAPPAAM
jgi:hypothetical protein